MAKFVWQNVRLFVAGADLTGVNNKLEVTAEREAKETTAFAPSGGVWAEVLAGLASTEISGEGQFEAGDTGKVDDSAFADLGSIVPVTVAPAGAASGALAYLTGALRAEYTLGGAIGDVAPWTAGMKGNWPLVRGLIAHPPGTARTSTSTGTGYQLGAVAAGQSLYAALHVLSVSGTSPTLTVQISSDDNSSFTSATQPISFTEATAPGSQLMRVAGPITDSYFKAKWTIGGTDPSFMFVVAFGIA